MKKKKSHHGLMVQRMAKLLHALIKHPFVKNIFDWKIHYHVLFDSSQFDFFFFFFFLLLENGLGGLGNNIF